MNSELFTLWEPDPAAKILGTGMNRFRTAYGVHGLAKINGDRFELLAVASDVPKMGLFRRFISDLKERHKTICIWFVEAPFLPMILVRYGFAREVEISGRGEIMDGYRWDKITASPPASYYPETPSTSGPPRNTRALSASPLSQSQGAES
jgi:hypothetical protein